jgi:sirohydrochlorin cobaltochelatase
MKRAVVLFGHGSRDPQWREPMDALAARLRQRAAAVEVLCAFLELQAPDLPGCCDALVANGIGAVTIVPVFFGVGRHAREDLPRLIDEVHRRHPGLQVQVTPAVGEWDDLLDGLAEAIHKRS